MNGRYEQLKPLAEKAWFVFHNERDYAHENAMLLGQLERFAELVTAEAVAREREACAQLCDDTGRVAPVTENEILHKQCYRLADLIRARGSK
jgi:hypothetical protein